MRPKLLLTVTLACLATFVMLPASGLGREPANQNDPCSSAGRNTCGTNGVGAYKNYRYGIRWFGDFRGAVPDVGPTFCIDLRWWYPAARYDFEEVSPSGLRNTNGAAISAAKQAQMAYALWTYGRSSKVNQQAAVMLYVHSLMGDGAPGEVDPAAVSPQAAALFGTISRNARRFRGPYRLTTSVTGGLTVGAQGSAVIRVVSATGAAVPNVSLGLATEGATGVPTSIRTNGSGIARIKFTAASIAGIKIGVKSADLASNTPRIFRASTPGAARQNGQRMAAADSQQLSASIEAPVAKGSLKVTTTASAANLLLTEASTDKVTIAGAPTTLTQTVTVNVFGPFPTAAAIACTGTPVATSTFVATGSGEFTTQPFTPTAPGWYTYQLTLPGNENVAGLTTPCAEPTESFRVQIQPRVRTIVSPAGLLPGEKVFDRVLVEGLAGQAVTVKAALYGPFASREAIKCDTTPVWTGTLNVTADGEYPTDAVALTVPGYYTYHETIAESELVRPFTTTCGDAAETPIVTGKPTITTQVNSKETAPGAQITDNVVITGLGVITATVQVELWGPFDTPPTACTGTPFATQTFTANGDGTYTTEPITIDRAGYYVYHESLAGGPANEPATTPCPEAAETTLSRPGPAVTTLASNEVVKPKSQIFDHLKVTGLGKTPATVEVQLFGPFATRGGIRCNTTPLDTVTVAVAGDGEYQSPKITVPRAGFYAFRERIPAAGLVPAFQGECGLVAETSLAAPLILTGKGDPVADQSFARINGAGGTTPTRVTIAPLRINAGVNPVGIDTRQGQLAVPIDILKLGWWRDGQTPGSSEGSVLIAGHVDSARRGGGAFVNLKNAKAGQRVKVETSGGKVYTYRITTVRRVLKAALPNNIFSAQGSPRLVLVTCGGPFLRNLGHYRDNIIVTAVPV